MRSFVATAGCAFALASARVAAAGPTTKVTIDSDPPHAKVFLNDLEEGVKCEDTPCTFDAPIGEANVIVVLDGYIKGFIPLELKKKPGKQTFKVTLQRAIATLVVSGEGAPKGVAVQVNDGNGIERAKGKVPQTFELAAGGYQVVFTHNGKKLDEQFIDLDANQELTVTPKATEVATRPRPDPDKDPGEEDLGDGGKPDVVKSATPALPRRQLFTLGVAFDVGFRDFSYDQAAGQYTVGENEVGQVMIGPALEVWPTRVLGMRALRGLSLFARAEFGFHQEVLSPDATMSTIKMPVTTFWRSYEISVRHRWNIVDKAAIEASGGYVRDQLQFSGQTTDIDFVPDADYQSIRIGAKGALLLGSLEPYLAAEGRIVLSGGALQTRFDKASVTGVHAALGVAGHVGPLVGRLEGAITNYSWDLGFNSATAMFRATGATDRVVLISTMLSYQY